MTATSLVFQNTTFDVTDRNGQPWLRLPQIEGALGYTNIGKGLYNIFARHADEFTASMTAVVKLPTAGGEQETRIFSLRGCHLLAMLSRTKIAKAFRAWVLDILDKETRPHHEPVPYVQNPTDVLSKAQCDILRNLLTGAAERLPKEQQAGLIITGWSKLKAHFKVGYRDIPQAEFAEAVSLVARHISTGELSGTEKTAQAALEYILGTQWAFSYLGGNDSNDFRLVMQEVDKKDLDRTLALRGEVAVPRAALAALTRCAA